MSLAGFNVHQRYIENYVKTMTKVIFSHDSYQPFA
jgi:hypothetical protein